MDEYENIQRQLTEYFMQLEMINQLLLQPATDNNSPNSVETSLDLMKELSTKIDNLISLHPNLKKDYNELSKQQEDLDLKIYKNEKILNVLKEELGKPNKKKIYSALKSGNAHFFFPAQALIIE